MTGMRMGGSDRCGILSSEELKEPLLTVMMIPEHRQSYFSAGLVLYSAIL